MNELVGQILASAAREGLWRSGEHILVAVSGGPDSIALLHILHTLAEQEGLLLTAAHIHHGLREASDEEAVTVRQYCAALAVPCAYGQLDVRAHQERTGQGTQVAARELRYDFLHATAAQLGASRIALGHHADDQAETVLMRVLRGTGTTGLSGMRMRRRDRGVELIRPLLEIPKAELAAYCREHRLPCVEDESNAERYYVRNALRLDIMPRLETYNPELREALCRLAELAGQEDDWIESQTEHYYERLVKREQRGFSMAREDLLGLHIALQRRLIKLILYYLSPEQEIVSFARIEAIREASADPSRSTWHTDVGAGLRFVREYDRLYWLDQSIHNASQGMPYQYEIIRREGRVVVLETEPPTIFELATEPATSGEGTPTSRYEAVFDAQTLRFPLMIRNRRPGDRMAVLGLEGTKKVQDMFVDAKIPPSQRETMPIVCDADGRLLWIPGLRRAAHALVGPESGERVRIRVRFA